MKISSYLNRFIIIIICRCIATAEKDDIKRIAHCSNVIKKNIFFTRKEKLLNKIKKIGFNSFLWGDMHNILCPENLELGENVHIGNNSYIRAEGGVIIGDNTHISKNFVLYTINHNYEGTCLPYDETFIYKPVVIGKNVWIGINVCILPGTIIGDGVIVGMGTVVSGNVPAYTIISSQKWRKIGERNKEHYEFLEKNGQFGGIDGELYINSHRQLNKIGDTKRSRRSILKVMEIKNSKIVKKIFLKSNDGIIAFENEKYSYRRLNIYKWYPEVLSIDNESISYEFINNANRLDIYIKSLTNDRDKREILKKIIGILFDLFTENLSHCDFHAKNLFYIKDDDIVKLIDFETISEMKKSEDFFLSYDIIGNEKKSPFYTHNMCIFSDSDFSISKIFKIKKEDFRIIAEEVLIDRLREASLSFFTRKNDNERHNLKMGLIYSTFDLRYLKVGVELAQRDTRKRLVNFGVNSKFIKNKTVLDIGSNIGGISFEIIKMCPRKIVGLEYDKNKVNISNLIAKIHNINNVSFYQNDVESDFFKFNFLEIFDIVFCLSLIDHLKMKEEFLKKVYNICRETLFLEGNSLTEKRYMINLLLEIGFKKVDFIGYSNDDRNKDNNNRPLFICKK